MTKLNGRLIASDKAQLDQQWEDLMKDVRNGKIDKEKAAYLMERLNAADKFLMAQGMYELL